ncbi:MAG TPA: hypothetical protein IAB04_01975 [Candidatus Avimonoglobus intestinipullorum]|uniref:Uncharacterized protein n=1 Tax=Candidatus Avimonoglobus intestinipullorum TaxID=2840699 RepID=A0A9D1S5X5_9FIRM|nr:hypothetical protein [Candidatus Avimonoglobus intestinipullorum]
MYRKYYSYNDMPQVMKPEPRHEIVKPEPPVHKKKEEVPGILEEGKLFGKFELDDVILIAVAIILLADDCDDKLLLLALGFIFITGML